MDNHHAVNQSDGSNFSVARVARCGNFILYIKNLIAQSEVTDPAECIHFALLQSDIILGRE